MSVDTSAAAAPDYGYAGEQRLRAFVEHLTGGRIVRMERQVCWRPAWFTDVDVGGETLKLHLRGDREGDVRRRDLADVSALLGRRFDVWADAEAALDAFVRDASVDDDMPLLALFTAIERRRLQLYGPTRIGHSALHVHLPPIR